MDKSLIKTVKIEFDVDGRSFATDVTLDWATFPHKGTIDLRDLQNDIRKGVKSQEDGKRIIVPVP